MKMIGNYSNALKAIKKFPEISKCKIRLIASTIRNRLIDSQHSNTIRIKFE